MEKKPPLSKHVFEKAIKQMADPVTKQTARELCAHSGQGCKDNGMDNITQRHHAYKAKWHAEIAERDLKQTKSAVIFLGVCVVLGACAVWADWGVSLIIADKRIAKELPNLAPEEREQFLQNNEKVDQLIKQGVKINAPFSWRLIPPSYQDVKEFLEKTVKENAEHLKPTNTPAQPQAYKVQTNRTSSLSQTTRLAFIHTR